MAYSIFTQPRGPNIDTNLLVDAAAKGSATGLALGTPFSNAVESAISGYRQGQAIYSEGQNQQIRANQIEQIPIQNERQRLALELDKERLESEQKANEAATLELEFQKNNKKLIEDAKLTELRAKARKSQEDVAMNDLTNEFAAILGSGDGFAVASALNNPKYEKVFLSKPEYYKQGIAIAGSKGVPVDQFMKRLTFAEQYAAQQKRDAQQTESFEKAVRELPDKMGQLSGNDQTGTVIAALADKGTAGVNPYDLIVDGKIITLPTPKEVKGVDGKMRSLTPDEALAYSKLPAQKRFKYNDTELDIPITTEFEKAYNDAKATYNIADGKRTGDEILQNFEVAKEKAGAPPAPTSPSAASAEKDPLKRRELRIKELEAKSALKSEQQTGTAMYSAERQTTRPVVINPNLPSYLQNQSPLIQAVASVESSWKTQALSPKGARGLMQVMPGTFDYVTKKYGLKDYDINNPEQNVEVGKIYLAEQLRKFGTAPGQGLELSLAAYNTGPGRVMDALQAAEVKSWNGVKAELKKMLNPKAYAEVSAYPDKVKAELLKTARVPASTFFGGVEESAEESYGATKPLTAAPNAEETEPRKYPSAFEDTAGIEQERPATFQDFPKELEADLTRSNFKKHPKDSVPIRELAAAYLEIGYDPGDITNAIAELPIPKKDAIDYDAEDTAKLGALYSYFEKHDQPLPYPPEFYSLEELRNWIHAVNRNKTNKRRAYRGKKKVAGWDGR